MNRLVFGELINWHLALLPLGSNEQVDTWTELPAGSNTAAACPPAINIGDFDNGAVVLRTVNPLEALYLIALALRCKMA